MDHGRSLRPVHHDQLKKSSRAISAEKQIPNGVFGDLLDDQCVTHNVLNVCRFDVVPERRAEDLHDQYRTTKPASLAELTWASPRGMVAVGGSPWAQIPRAGHRGRHPVQPSCVLLFGFPRRVRLRRRTAAGRTAVPQPGAIA